MPALPFHADLQRPGVEIACAWLSPSRAVRHRLLRLRCAGDAHRISWIALQRSLRRRLALPETTVAEHDSGGNRPEAVADEIVGCIQASTAARGREDIVAEHLIDFPEHANRDAQPNRDPGHRCQ